MPKKKKAISDDKLMSLIDRAGEGDTKAIEELKQDLPAEGYTRLLEIFANLRRNTEDALMKAYAGEDLLTREGIQRQADQMRAELAGPGASPLDCVLVDRIVCCWIQANHADSIYANNLKSFSTLKQMEHYQKAQDRATRRFLNACKTLAQVRKLIGPNIQVNIAENQMNVMNPGGDVSTDGGGHVEVSDGGAKADQAVESGNR